MGLIEVAVLIEEIEGEKLSWNWSDLGISEPAWNRLIHRGIKPVLAFAHPDVLTTVSRAVSYYRMLAMVSQKSMGNVRMPIISYERGRKLPQRENALALAQLFNKIISRLIEADEALDPREFDLWRGLAAGAQAQGSWQTFKGRVAEEVVNNP